MVVCTFDCRLAQRMHCHVLSNQSMLRHADNAVHALVTPTFAAGSLLSASSVLRGLW